jgi:hypothetical protein
LEIADVIKDRQVPLIDTGGRPSIDWPKLKELWLTDLEYQTLDMFLTACGIKSDTRVTKANVRDWPQHKPSVPHLIEAESDPYPEPAEVFKDVPSIVPEVAEDSDRNNQEVQRIWSKIRRWRANQAESDYILGERLKQFVDRAMDQLEDRDYFKTYDLLNKGCSVLAWG